MWFSHAPLTEISSFMARLWLLGWHIRASWSVLLLWVSAPLAATSNIKSEKVGKDLFKFNTARRGVLQHEQTEIKNCWMLWNTYWSQWMQMCWCVLLLFGVWRATHPLLPQLLFQRRQATFLPQHAAVPPAERRIHITQLCATVLAAYWPNCRAYVKRAEGGLGKHHSEKSNKGVRKTSGCDGQQQRQSCFDVIWWCRPDQ